jgi:hypothetical protein
MDRGDRVPLHARTRAGGAPAVPAGGSAAPCPVRHCWVNAPADGGQPRPGLLLEWRKDDLGRWEGRVSYPAELRPGRWATVEEWLSAELLSTA